MGNSGVHDAVETQSSALRTMAQMLRVHAKGLTAKEHKDERRRVLGWAGIIEGISLELTGALAADQPRLLGRAWRRIRPTAVVAATLLSLSADTMAVSDYVRHDQDPQTAAVVNVMQLVDRDTPTVLAYVRSRVLEIETETVLVLEPAPTDPSEGPNDYEPDEDELLRYAEYMREERAADEAFMARLDAGAYDADIEEARRRSEELADELGARIDAGEFDRDDYYR